MWEWSTTKSNLEYYQNWLVAPISSGPDDRGYTQGGQWLVQKSNQEAIPICQKRQGKVCPEDWLLFEDQCYKWFR